MSVNLLDSPTEHVLRRAEDLLPDLAALAPHAPHAALPSTAAAAGRPC